MRETSKTDRLCGNCRHFVDGNTKKDGLILGPHCAVGHPDRYKPSAYHYTAAQSKWKCSNNHFEAK